MEHTLFASMRCRLDEDRLRVLLLPFVGDRPVPRAVYEQLALYLHLLLKWNARTNLTAIREPEEIVTRHFGESLFLGRHLPPSETFLDYGAGAGFPGVPVQLLLPGLKVTLAESQGKKVSFLREAVRVLGLNTEIWPSRVEAMDVERTFDVVALRAVDKMDEARQAAAERVRPGGTLALLISGTGDGIPVPGGRSRMLRLVR